MTPPEPRRTEVVLRLTVEVADQSLLQPIEDSFRLVDNEVTGETAIDAEPDLDQTAYMMIGAVIQAQPPAVFRGLKVVNVEWVRDGGS